MRWLPSGTSSSVMPSAILSKEAFITVHHGTAVGSGKQELPVDLQSLGKPRCDYFRPGRMPTQSSRGFPIAGNSDVPGTSTRRLRKSNSPTNPGEFIAGNLHPFCKLKNLLPEADSHQLGAKTASFGHRVRQNAPAASPPRLFCGF